MERHYTGDMQSPSDCSALNGQTPLAQFALVSYITGPLGKYLDELRLRLDPACKPNAHVTILPPRTLSGTPEEAAAGIRRLSPNFDPLTVRLGDVAMFPVSNVIYIEVAAGREALLQMFHAMNSGASAFREPFPYHPHITLAMPLAGVDPRKLLEDARRDWAAYPQERKFRVEKLSFVQSYDRCCWIDLEDIPLNTSPHLGVNQTNGFAPPIPV
jgi:2'-5' RNA ligase